METFEQLLHDIERIARHHNELSVAKGERFNIFSILQVEHYEVSTHSRVLAELLDPKGRHELGDTFLKLFLEEFGVKQLDTKTAWVETEYYIGPVTETTGGRIDIFISDKADHRLFIENKIYAEEQENQLLRYSNFDPSAALFYLTLDGKPSSEESLSKDKYRPISYQCDVVLWLVKCRNAAANAPMVRETITQYINLIKKLTNQDANSKMKEEIIAAFTRNREMLSACFTLRDSMGDIYSAILQKLKGELEVLAAAKHCKLDFQPDFLNTNSAFYFSNEELTTLNLKIGFTFGAGSATGFEFGFCNLELPENGTLSSQVQEIKSRFEQEFDSSQLTDWWPCYARWRQWENWDSEIFQRILFTSEFPQDVEIKLEAMLGIVRSVMANP